MVNGKWLPILYDIVERWKASA